VAESEPSAWLPRYLLAQVHLERGDPEGARKELARIPQDEGFRTEISAARQSAEGLSTPNRLIRTFEAHTGAVSPLAALHASLSADGRYALSGSEDKTVKLWDVENGRCLHTFKGPTYVSSVGLSADGRHMVSGDLDHMVSMVKLWDMKTGRCLRTFAGHTDWVQSVCLSADSRYVLSGSNDKTVKLWEVESERCLRTFAGHTNRVQSVRLSADSRYVLSGSDDKTVRLWEVESGRCLRTLEGHTKAVTSVSLSADSRYVLSGSSDRTLKLWEVESGRCLRTLEGHNDWVVSACLSADERYVLSGGSGLTLWEVESGRCLRTFKGDSPKSVSLSAGGWYVLSERRGKTLNLFEVESPRVPYQATHRLSRATETAQVVESSVRYYHALREARRAAESGEDVAVCRWLRIARQQRGQARATAAIGEWARLYTRLRRRGLTDMWCCWVNGEMRDLRYPCFSADGQYVLAASDDKTMSMWEVESGRRVRTFEGHTHAIMSVSLSTGAQYALSGGNDKTVKLWEVENGHCIRTFEGHTHTIMSVSLSADGRYALSGDGDGAMKLWDVESGRCLRTFEERSGAVVSVGLSADGRHALSGNGYVGDMTWCGASERKEPIKLWDVESGRCLRTFEGHTGWVISVRLIADGRYVLSVGSDRTLKLWEVESGCCLRTFEGHTISVWLSPDERYVLSGGSAVLKLCEVESGRCLRTMELGSRAESISVSADWRHLLVASEDGLSRWFLDWDLEENHPADWEEGARPYLALFLRAHQPYAAELSQDSEPTDEEVTMSLTRRGRPVWTEQDFEGLLYTLGCAGYGWLRTKGVRRELERMAAEWKDEE
jgi:WD40 repeat protein